MKNYMITAACLLFSFLFLFLCSCSDLNQEFSEINSPGVLVKRPDKTQDLNIIYKTAPAERGEIDLMLDIFYPPDLEYGESPLVVAFHGGGWIAGERSQVMFIFEPVIKKLRDDGYTVATVQYRYASKKIYFPAMLEDCIDAILYLQNNAEKYYIDKNSIGVMGYSAGAQLAMLACYAAEEFSAEIPDIKYCLSFAGPTKMYGDEPKNYPYATLYLLENLFDGPYPEKEEVYKRGSPYFYLDAAQKKIPLFLAHDERDNIVPFNQSLLMRNKADETGVPCEMLILNGYYHQIDFSYDYANISPSRDESVGIILDFIYKYSGK